MISDTEVLRMSCMKWVNSKIKNFKWYDMSMVKLAVVAFTLMLVTFWPSLASLKWYWYAIMFVLLTIKPMYTLFKK
jgi:hypothetical protein